MSMSIPGFTAEVTLSDGHLREWGMPRGPVHGGQVQPASVPRVQLNPIRVRPIVRDRYVLDPCFWRRRCQNIYDPRPEFPDRILFTHCWIERVCP